ncbi:MAG: hypothetical protein ACJ8C4_05805 [Gemmataceae bacterium]
MRHKRGDCPGWHSKRYSKDQCRPCRNEANPDTYLKDGPVPAAAPLPSSASGAIQVVASRRICLNLIANSQHRNGRGETVDPQGVAQTCQNRIAWECKIHGTVTLGVEYGGFECCDLGQCPDDTRRRPPTVLTPEVAAELAAIAGPVVPRTPAELDAWCSSPAVQDAHRFAARQYLEQLPSYPGDRRGRGIVLAGGGRYAPGNYLHIRLLRELGCMLPVQLWHRGSAEPIPDCIRELAGVEVIDAETHPLRWQWRILDGWQLKAIAVLNSGWLEVLFSDADNYPVNDPTSCFAHNPQGAVLWPDVDGQDGRLDWSIYGVQPPVPNIGVNGGSSLFNVERTWRALNLAVWFDAHSDFYYRTAGYGDQDTLRAAFVVTGTPFTMYATRPKVMESTFVLVQPGPTGQPMFVHSIGRKPEPQMAWIPLIAEATGIEWAETRVHAILDEYQFLTTSKRRSA